MTFSTTTAVNWQVNGVPAAIQYLRAPSGPEDSTPLPVRFPASPTVTITAISQADNTKTGTATLQITPPTLVISPKAPILTFGSQQGFTATSLQQPVSPAWSITLPQHNPE